MAEALAATAARLDPRKFQDPLVTASGERRAQVALKSLDTLWFNTGTLCNLTCRHCYIESSPTKRSSGLLERRRSRRIPRRDRNVWSSARN